MPSKATLERYVAMVEGNRHAEAIEEFYAEHASVRENLGPPRIGRALLAEGERKMLARAKAVQSRCIRPVFVEGDRVVGRWWFHFEFHDGRVMELEELSYQRWEGERIVEEQFFYDPAQLKRPPSPDDIAKFDRWFAIECNNRAWRLSEQATRTGAEDLEMLHAAHASAYHWGRVGTELHRNRAAMLLAHAHAALGNGRAALRYGRESFDYVARNASPAWEVAFAHVVLAHAAAAAGEKGLHAEHYRIGEALGRALDDEDRAIFDATFRSIPAPATT
jgi:hypothetical protein